MLLQVIATAEALGALVARERLFTAVDALVARQLLVARERFAAVRLVAAERALAGVAALVSLQLTPVRESHMAQGADVLLGAQRAGALLVLLGECFLGEQTLVGQLIVGGELSAGILCGSHG